MAFDSTVMAAVVAELSDRLTAGRISKIYQPQPDEIALLIYAGGANHRLLVSANARFARLHLSRIEKKNPPHPPTFCMLLRKYVEGGRILAIRQVGRERICRIHIGVTDELGNPAEFVLVAEMMGKHSNIVLLNPQGRIVDAIRRVTEEVNRYRELLPGLAYVPPPPVGKLDPAAIAPADLSPGDDPAKPVWQMLLDRVDGLGPLLAKEAAVRAGYAPETPASRTAPEALTAVVRELASPQEYQPCLLLDPEGRLKDYHVLPLQSWPGPVQTGFTSICAGLEAFYGRKEESDRLAALRGSLSKLVRDEAARVRRKLHLQTESQKTAENAEEFRIKGELITANLWQIKKGDEAAAVVNYYDPEGSMVNIALDPALSPAENAQAYYRRYQKARSGKQVITQQVEKSAQELAYLEQVEATLLAAASLPELEEIRRELQAEGYLGEKKERKGSSGKTAEEKPVPPLAVHSTDGLEIWIGRNNKQNDYLTLKLAAPHDIWLHTKEIPGSHVILRVPPGQPVPDRAIHEAAALAAWYSRGRESAAVPVDYALRKHVRKPAGARPGMVIYEQQKTLWVTPDPELNPILKRHLGGQANGGTGETGRDGGSSDPIAR
ncbi:MAG TPA: NFACT RNA binding domain-containing protein [Symbiobacteriaceae bacterium]|nr:NFACT RNA binding domain-containing protein [Symbiobacteriaceae bacterium]